MKSDYVSEIPISMLAFNLISMPGTVPARL
jgi:hypothetical protein